LTLSLDRDNKKQRKRIYISENMVLEHGNGMSVLKKQRNGHAIERLLFNWVRENTIRNTTGPVIFEQIQKIKVTRM
jgi:hypothetical protein